MTRTMLTVASVIAAIVAYGSAAHACISCDYVPPVVNSGTTTYQKAPARQRTHTVKRERGTRTNKKLSTTQPSAPKETATIAPASTAQTESSAIATRGDAGVSTPPAAVASAPATGPQNENSEITQAAASTGGGSSAKPVEQAKADKSGECKKFFPSAGLTLTVPCE